MVKTKSKYTKSMVEGAVLKSESVYGVMRILGMKVSTGSMHRHTKSLIEKYSIDTSHFTGRGHRKGKKDPKRLTFKEILVFDRLNGIKEQSHIIRRALDEIGVKRICLECGQGEVWNGKPLQLEIEHKNGNPLDNRKKNLYFICSNCHTQTETFGKIKGCQEKQSMDKFCLECGVSLSRGNKSGYCQHHHSKYR